MNPRNINIGVIGSDLVWTLLLDQIGVRWWAILSTEEIDISKFSLLIINRPLTADEEQTVDRFTESGGAILYTTEEGHRVADAASSCRHISSLSPHVFEEYSFFDIFDINAKTYVFGAERLIFCKKNGPGIVSYVGVSVQSIHAESKPKRKNFFTPRDRMPSELISRRSKSALRQMIHSHLEYLHHQQGLPFVHTWFYPNNAETIFTFRIDSDKGTHAEIEEIFQLSERYDIPTTWFLDVKSHEEWLSYFSKFTKQETALHCYHHVVHPTTGMNVENFEKALRVMQENKLNPKGIAAPTGAWSIAIGKAARDLKFLYSSEFAYDYDNLPSFPILGKELSPVVQLPIHPTCVGTMRREHMTSEEMIKYFKELIDQKLARREPICLYHHPSHRTNEVFQEVFLYINGNKIPKMRFDEYAEWWKRRNESSFIARFNGEAIQFSGVTAAPDVFVRISLPDGTETISSIRDSIATTEKIFERRTQEWNFPADLMRARSFTFRHLLHNALDWWIKITE